MNYTDLDLDRANITFVWYVNSTNVYNYTASNVANGTNVSSVLNASYYNVSDVVNVSVYANDSYNLSITRNASRTVQSSLINNVSVTPSSGYAGELFTFTTNASSATAVNVSFGGITLQLTNTSSEMWNYTSYAVNLNPGTYTLNFTAISGYDDSFSDTSLSITILLRSTTGSDTVEQSLSLSKRERCPENEVTFYTSQDAEMRLLLSNPYEGLIASKTVGSSGSVTFVLTKAGTYEATASKTGYKSATLVFTYALCAPVANETNVTTNHTTNDTVNPPPPPLPPPPPDGKKGCTTNSECTDAQYCSGGSCIDVSSGSCGYLSNHSWFQYACCNDSDCNAGYVCFEHACIERNITIVAAEKAYIGSTEAIQVLANGKPLSNALIQVSVPNGETIQLTTDNEGKATFQLQYKGDYKIAVVEGCSPLKTRVLLSMTKTSAEDKKTSSYLFMENEWILTGAVVMFLAIALIVYYFYTRKKSDSGPYTSKFRKK